MLIAGLTAQLRCCLPEPVDERSSLVLHLTAPLGLDIDPDQVRIRVDRVPWCLVGQAPVDRLHEEASTLKEPEGHEVGVRSAREVMPTV